MIWEQIENAVTKIAKGESTRIDLSYEPIKVIVYKVGTVIRIDIQPKPSQAERTGGNISGFSKLRKAYSPRG